ncbi:hypothetical protein Dimus_033699, partial [Dionaea muscipula]
RAERSFPLSDFSSQRPWRGDAISPRVYLQQQRRQRRGDFATGSSAQRMCARAAMALQCAAQRVQRVSSAGRIRAARRGVRDAA